MNDFKGKLRKLLVTQLDYRIEKQRNELEIAIVEFLFSIRNQGHTQEHIMSVFNDLRGEIVYAFIPDFYKTFDNNDLEDAHTDFINDIESILMHCDPPPHFWESNEQEFMRRYR